MKINELKNKKIAILWFWKEGKSSLHFLLKIWIVKENITLLDKNQIEEDYQQYKHITWENYLEELWDFDIIFKAPWISPYHEKISPNRDKLYSNTQLFFDNYDWKVIWVTATKGKSTTVTLLYKTLIEAWLRVKLVGNIGTPVLDEINILENQNYDYIIYELSSYMLETFSPKCYIWVLGNIFPCHLDWHGNEFNIYKNAKLHILENANHKLVNADFQQYLNSNINSKIITFWTHGNISFKNGDFYIEKKKILKDQNILLEWVHNRINITSVIAILNIIFKTESFINPLKKVLWEFSGLPHRLENIGSYKWITFIDDGISVTPQSTIEAIKTFDQEIWTIILWWKNTWIDIDSYRKLKNQILESNIKNIILLPETWDFIFNESKNIEQWIVSQIQIDSHNINIYKTDNMKDIISFCYKYTPVGKKVLLSNAAQSYNLWKNYIEKWNEFKTEVIEQVKK